MDCQRIKHVANIIKQTKEQGYQVVTVVSAMGHTTDHLLNLANNLNSHADTRELDLLVSTGEIVSATLTTLALQQCGLKARTFTGAAAGILTDTQFGDARIEYLFPQALEKSVVSGEVAVVAGFQGVSNSGETTTLGRGGSDITAIALAAALEAEVCEIYTDVNGVYDCDPNRFSSAQKFDFISYEQMIELAKNGAQVLNTHSVEIAQEKNVAVRVRSTFEPDNTGTLVVASSAIPVQQKTGSLVA